MNTPKISPNSSPSHSRACGNFEFIGFWSLKVSDFVDELEKLNTNDRVNHHDLFMQFINRECFEGKGEVDQRKRVKGSKHDDLTLPLDVIEFKIRSKALESLPSVLRDAEAIFERNDYLYFGYLRKRGWRDETKDIKIRGCIYYLYTLVISKQILPFNMRDLIKEITKEEIEFTKEIAKKSGIDLDEEELYGVGNIIKEIKLERRLEEKDQIIKDKEKQLEDKEKQLEDKEKQLEDKEKQLEDKEKQLEEQRKLRLEKEREIKRLKTQLEEK